MDNELVLQCDEIIMDGTSCYSSDELVMALTVAQTDAHADDHDDDDGNLRT